MFLLSSLFTGAVVRLFTDRFRSPLLLLALAAGLVPAASAAQVTLSWADNSSNETGFRIQRAAGSGSFAQVGTAGANVRSYVDTTAAAGTAYQYRVCAYNSAGASAYSNVASATPASGTTTNTAPTIAAIADRTISVGGTTGAIGFTIGDAQTSASSLTVTRSSSNLTLVPLANVTLGGSGANRTVTVRGAAGRTGSATISIKVSDGKLDRTETFIVTATSSSGTSNTAPTISTIANRTIATNGTSGAIPFTIGDAQTATTSLSLTRNSSNQSLVPTSNITFGGSGANRTVTVKPATNRTGSATIYVKVSDGKLQTFVRFVVTVTGGTSSPSSPSGGTANTAPTISGIADRTIATGSTTGAIPFTIGDAQTSTSSLTLIRNSSNQGLIPTSNIAFGGSGANRTVAVKPVSGQTGSATIWVKVSDGSLDRVESFMVNVTKSSTLTYTNLGNPAVKGSVSENNGTIQIRAAGAGSLTSDQHYFGYTSLSSESELTVRVSSLTRVGAESRAGLMYRASTAANSAYVGILLTTDYGLVLTYRTATGASVRYEPPVPGKAPQWLRLMRTGNSFYAFTSENGTDWDLVEFAQFSLPATALGGLAVTSQNASTATTAVFDNLVVE